MLPSDGSAVATAKDKSPKKKKDGGGGSGSGSGAPGTAEAAAYQVATTFAVIEVEVSKPFVPRKTRAEVAQSVASLVPPRSVYPRDPAGGDRAVADYESQVAAVASQLIGEYRKHEAAVDPGEGAVRQRLLYELNTSGK